MPLPIEIERELDGRWLAEIPALPGVLACGSSPEDTIVRVRAMALRTVAEQVEHGEQVLTGVLDIRDER